MMLAETFLKEFGRLAAGPDGIRKLRELVLNLAISGRLSNRRPEDGHAHALVEAAGKAIRSAVTSGIIRKPRYFGKAENSTLATSIPANWVATSLGNLGLISPRNEAPDEAVAGFVPMAEIEAKFGLPHGFEERKWADIKSGYTHVANGDVVLAKITPCFENGKSAAIAGLPNDLGAGTTELHVLRQLAHVVEKEYVLAFLKSETFIQAGVPRMTGTAGQKRIPADYFALSPFPLPPLAEQRRIVAKVNELMTLCDELETRQAEETELKRAASASVLHHLTEAKSSQETGARWSLFAPRFGELFDDLETIKALRVAVTDAAANGAFSTPSERAQFTQGTVDDVLVSSNSGWSPRCDNVPATGDEWGVLKVSAVTWGVFKPEENKRLPSDMEPRPQHALGAGDVLVSRANTAELVGRGVKVPEDYPRLMLSDKIVRLVLSDAVRSDYFLLAFHASAVRAYFSKVATGTSDSMRNITRNHIKLAPIALPLIAEQKRIVAKFDALMALCDRLEEQVREGERLNAELMASLVHSLTETDPDGGGAAEPASLAEDASAIAAPKPANGNAPETPETKSTLTPPKSETKTRAAPGLALSVDNKFQEAVLVAAIVQMFFEVGGEPIGNFRLQKAVYFARRKMGEHVGEMAYLKKAAGPYNPSMKYSGGIAIAKQKNWLREARGRFGFGHVLGPEASDAGEWIGTYRYTAPARWVAEHFRYKKNEEWETLATVDYTIEHLQTLGIEPDAAQILQYIASDPEWRPKIEKLGLTEISVATAMLEVQALFSAEGGDDSV